MQTGGFGRLSVNTGHWFSNCRVMQVRGFGRVAELQVPRRERRKSVR